MEDRAVSIPAFLDLFRAGAPLTMAARGCPACTDGSCTLSPSSPPLSLLWSSVLGVLPLQGVLIDGVSGPSSVAVLPSSSGGDGCNEVVSTRDCGLVAGLSPSTASIRS